MKQLSINGIKFEFEVHACTEMSSVLGALRDLWGG